MKEDLFDIIKEKEYFELSDSERVELAEFVSNEEEFIQMKSVMLQVDQITFDQLSPKDEVKKSLDDLFYETHPKAAPVWYMSAVSAIVPRDKAWHQQPLMRVAAIALLLLIAIPFFNNDLPIEKERLASNDKQVEEVVIDSVSEQDEAVAESVENRTGVVLEEEQNQIQNEIILDNRSQEVATREDNYDDNDGLTPITFSEDLSAQPATTTTYAFSANTTVSSVEFNHPDGVFQGYAIDESNTRLASASMSVSDNKKVLDVLTVAF